MEFERNSVVHVGAVRTTLSGFVGERVVQDMRVANVGNGFAEEQQAHVQSQPGPQQFVIDWWPPAAVQATADSYQHQREWIQQRHFL